MHSYLEYSSEGVWKSQGLPRVGGENCGKDGAIRAQVGDVHNKQSVFILFVVCACRRPTRDDPAGTTTKRIITAFAASHGAAGRACVRVPPPGNRAGAAAPTHAAKRWTAAGARAAAIASLDELRVPDGRRTQPRRPRVDSSSAVDGPDSNESEDPQNPMPAQCLSRRHPGKNDSQFPLGSKESAASQTADRLVCGSQ